MATTSDLTQGLGRTLLLWSILSFVFGVLTFYIPDQLIQGIGLQAILWGAIDAMIALFTLFKQKGDPPEKLAKILKINVGLDIVYMAVGAVLLLILGQDIYIAGNGIGVMIQGAFLFVLDLYYFTLMNRLIPK